MSDSSTRKVPRLLCWSGTLHDAFCWLWLRQGKLEDGRHEDPIEAI